MPSIPIEFGCGCHSTFCTRGRWALPKTSNSSGPRAPVRTCAPVSRRGRRVNSDRQSTRCADTRKIGSMDSRPVDDAAIEQAVQEAASGTGVPFVVVACDLVLDDTGSICEVFGY